MYHYAGNNPIKYSDPDGNFAIAIPLIPAIGEILVKTAAVIAAGALGMGIGELVKSISNSRTKENPKNYVYHSTSFQPFIDALMANGNSAIDKSKTNPDCRFGQQFYVAADPVTACAEAGYIGPLVKFKMSENAKIFDLTDPCTAERAGYSQGMSRSEVRNIMENWDLSSYDAIRYPSEKNPGGINYAILNPEILTPVGVE